MSNKKKVTIQSIGSGEKDSFIILSMTDVTAIKRFEKERKRIEDRYLNIYFTSTAHDQRTPLTQLIGIIECLHEYVANNKLALQMLSLANSSCQVLIQINDQISELSRIRLNKFVIKESEFDIREKIMEVFTVAKIQAEFKQLQMLLNFDRGVPKVFFADCERILLVLNVLIGNSLKYTTRGRIQLSLRLTNPPLDLQLEGGS